MSPAPETPPRAPAGRPAFVETRCSEEARRCSASKSAGRGTASSSSTGRPGLSAIREAVGRSGGAGEVIALPENVHLVAQALPGWEPKAASLHFLPDAAEGVRLLSGWGELAALAPGLPPYLRAEFSGALGRGAPMAAALVDGSPASFCYAASGAEGLWDASR